MVYEGTVLTTFPQEKLPMIRGKSREKAADGREKKTGSREKIIALLSEDGTLTMAALARTASSSASVRTRAAAGTS